MGSLKFMIFLTSAFNIFKIFYLGIRGSNILGGVISSVQAYYTYLSYRLKLNNNLHSKLTGCSVRKMSLMIPY